MTLPAPQMSRIRGTRAWMVAAMGPSPPGDNPVLIVSLSRPGEQKPGLRHPLVRRDGEELGEVVGQRDLGEQRDRLAVPFGVEALAARRADLGQLLVDEPLDQVPLD